MDWEGENSIVEKYLEGLPKYCWYLKFRGTKRPLFSFSSLDELVTEAKRWAHNPRVWELIKDDVYKFMEYEFGKKIEIKPKVSTIEKVLLELEEIGYKAEFFSYGKIYEGGAILPDGRIIEIDGDDHTILDALPNTVTYRFIDKRNDLYFRFPVNPTKIQIEVCIMISPQRFKFVAIDIVSGFDLIKSFTKEFAIGTKTDLRKVLYEIFSRINYQ